MPLDDNTSENVEKPVRRTEANPKFYPDFSRKLVCIEYPGLVENVDKAFDTLGGMTSIEKVRVLCTYNHKGLESTTLQRAALYFCAPNHFRTILHNKINSNCVFALTRLDS